MNEDNPSLYLAKNIEDLRNKKHMSQARLAELADLPRTTLTNMESGFGNPSLSNLVKISSALGVGIEQLLSRPRLDCTLIKADEIPKQYRSRGAVEISKLLPDKIKGIEIDKILIEPNSTMGGHPHLSGTKEYMTVLKGEIIVFLQGESFTVKKNEVFAFPGGQPHSYQNPKSTRSEFISVVIPVPASI